MIKKNLYLDLTTKDLTTTTSHNLRFTSDLSEFVSQKIENVLFYFTGEWFLDFTRGIDYFGQILIKNPDLNQVNNLLSNEILSIEEIQEILEINLELETSTRVLTVDYKVLLVDENILKGEQEVYLL